MAKSKLNSIRLNQIIDFNKIENDSFLHTALMARKHKLNFIKTHFYRNVSISVKIKIDDQIKSNEELIIRVENAIRNNQIGNLIFRGKNQVNFIGKCNN